MNNEISTRHEFSLSRERGNDDTFYSHKHGAILIFHQFQTIIIIGRRILAEINETKALRFAGLMNPPVTRR